MFNRIILFGVEAVKVPELSAGHPKPPAGAMASKCPFLAAEMGQKNSGVVREASMELQEDVSEIRTLQQGPGQVPCDVEMRVSCVLIG